MKLEECDKESLEHYYTLVTEKTNLIRATEALNDCILDENRKTLSDVCKALDVMFAEISKYDSTLEKIKYHNGRIR